MTDLQAAIGLVQLGRLDEIVARRRELAAALPRTTRRRFAGLTCVDDPAYGTTNYQSFWVRLDSGFGVGRNDAHGRARRRRHLGPPRASWPPTSSPPCARFARGPLPVTERLTASIADPAAVPRHDRSTTVDRGRRGDPGRPADERGSPSGPRRRGRIRPRDRRARPRTQRVRARPWTCSATSTTIRHSLVSVRTGLPVLGPLEWIHDHPDVAVTVCIGSPAAPAAAPRRRRPSRARSRPVRHAGASAGRPRQDRRGGSRVR